MTIPFASVAQPERANLNPLHFPASMAELRASLTSCVCRRGANLHVKPLSGCAAAYSFSNVLTQRSPLTAEASFLATPKYMSCTGGRANSTSSSKRINTIDNIQIFARVARGLLFDELSSRIIDVGSSVAQPHSFVTRQFGSTAHVSRSGGSAASTKAKAYASCGKAKCRDDRAIPRWPRQRGWCFWPRLSSCRTIFCLPPSRSQPG